jgi:hypothetical protein
VLREALQEASVMGRFFRALLEEDLDPSVMCIWHRWTRARDQKRLENPAGYIVNRLREGDVPLIVLSKRLACAILDA